MPVVRITNAYVINDFVIATFDPIGGTYVGLAPDWLDCNDDD